MVKAIERNRVAAIFGISTGMTTLAELGYLVVWGAYLFPDGSLAGKVVWTGTCGIAMGMVIGGTILALVEGRLEGATAAGATCGIVLVTGSYCAWLCAQIDKRFDYFGGVEHGTLFILSGVIPALLGGAVLGTLLYARPAASSRSLEPSG